MGYRCHACGAVHDEPPMAFHAEEPSSWAALPKAKRKRSQLSSDQCVIDDQHFFVRGLIELPVRGLREPLTWGVWVSLSEQNFLRASKLWETPGREREPPYFGWLNTELAPLYPSTLSLKTHVHTRKVGLRPLVELEPTDHPLAVEQREGITRQRLAAIWSALAHQ